MSNSHLHTRERNTVAFLDATMAKTQDEPLDWTKLPDELQYLAKPAEKYGRYQFDDKIDDFLTNKMTPAEKLELVALSAQFERDQRLIQQWLDKNNITLHPEARLVYFTMCLVGAGCDSGLLQKER